MEDNTMLPDDEIEYWELIEYRKELVRSWDFWWCVILLLACVSTALFLAIIVL